ncbi:MAG: 2-oxo acid dehydrogenase subunit E2 [Bacteroidales bacterium]|nr:2-oxo acid dehydrogenase subunit E2 [Bacteroidales bacterium]
MSNFQVQKFPDSRITTIDIVDVGKRKHHIAGMIALDVTQSRLKIRDYNKSNVSKISFNGWLIHVIASTIKKHETPAAYLKGKNKLMIFEDINVSMLVEKELAGAKVPIPLIIEKANQTSIESITKQIANAKNDTLSEKDIVLGKKTGKLEKLYYRLPGFVRKYFWKFLLCHPKLAYKNMGNVAFTSIGMMGKIDGWFIPVSIHPLCFGVGSIVKKPVVINDKVEIREILNMTILFDHDVIDGAPMARFIVDLTKKIESGMGL